MRPIIPYSNVSTKLHPLKLDQTALHAGANTLAYYIVHFIANKAIYGFNVIKLYPL
jgi:hypothetical protein